MLKTVLFELKILYITCTQLILYARVYFWYTFNHSLLLLYVMPLVVSATS